MAWRAELKRRKWYVILETDMPSIFSQYLYDTWYASLSEEDKQRLEERRRKKQEEHERELCKDLMKIAAMTSTLLRYMH